MHVSRHSHARAARQGKLPLSSVALDVARRFHEAQNARYRRAGMPQMVVRMRPDGTIDSAPARPAGARAVPMGAEGTAVLWDPARDDGGAVRTYRVLRDGRPVATVHNTTWFLDRTAGAGHTYEIRAVDHGGLVSGATLAATQEAGQQQPGGEAQQPAPATSQAVQGAAGVAPATQEATTAAQDAQPGTTAPGARPEATAPGVQAAAAPPGSQGDPSTSPAQPGAEPAAAAAPLAPQYSGLRPTGPNSFSLAWSPVAGAVLYGIYTDGKLIGHTPDLTFAGKVAGRQPATIRIDAVLADGTRTPAGALLGVRRGTSGMESAVLEPAQA